MDVLQLSLLALFPALVIAAGLTDLTSMTIPNWISGVLIAGFFVAALVLGLSPMAIAAHVGVGLAALVAGAILFALRFLGGGDAKLMAAVCLWLGVSGWSPFVLWTAAIGGLFCLALLVARSHAQPLVAGGPGWIVRLMEPGGGIPYGVAIAAGALLAWPASPLVTAAFAG
ncbi:MAG: prepilin peptidase [Alphaproteobacteria bacterium]|nr:prepilin peptidase [Alphaproteobacteria bacterium]MBU2270600.1 prepilin peptidase [Alphaproteobacteria bacterium]MBU2418371.1 prepilin peptidase [Alphaproteobacteria bacterium]